MRRLVFPMIVASGLVVIGASSASAEPAPTAGTAKAVAGKKICKVTDPKLDELSGIVATKSGFIVINDSTTLENHKRVFYLNDECAVTKSVRYGGNGPRDTEDMILSPDGKTLWIADIGDNDANRETIGVWTMPVDGSTSPKIHRLSYPSGERHDAEALLLNGDGTPIIVTKEVGKPAGIYTPTAALKTDNTEGVPLKKVGQLTVPPSDTSANTFSRLGRGTVDGGAIAPGGERVALRTYTDALEWTVSGGDVLAAIQGKPRVTPLPDEQLGEAITYSPDGKYFYTVSDMQGRPQDGDNNILRYTPAANIVAAKTTTAGAAAGKSSGSWYSNLSLNDITYMVGAVGVLGAILLGLGVFGIVRARKRPPREPQDRAGVPSGPSPTDAQTEFVPFRGPQSQQPGVYGGAPQPGVYGGRPALSAPQRGSGVYGGPPAGPGAPGQPAGRPGQGVPPGGRPGQGVPPCARPGQGMPPAARPSQSGQPAGRPGGGGGGLQPGRPTRGGVYGAPPAPDRNGAAGQSQRPSGFFGAGGADADRDDDQNNYADVNGSARGRGRDYDNPGYGRTPYGR
jgi:hypothetical protein